MSQREKIGADMRGSPKRRSPQPIEIKRERVGLVQTKMSNREALDILIGGDGWNRTAVQQALIEPEFSQTEVCSQQCLYFSTIVA